MVDIFPSEASIIRLIGAVLLEANDEWQMQHRSMGVEDMGEMLRRSFLASFDPLHFGSALKPRMLYDNRPAFLF